jgi:glyoxylase-like metal-dependent hydrolase (beta-lactamase superfamily II)
MFFLARRVYQMGISSLLALLTASAMIAPAIADDAFTLEWQQLADGVWAGVRPDSYNAPVMGSTVLVIGERGVFVFDPAGFALQGERLVAKVSELTALPITHMAISHWHGDHNLGIYKVLEAYPGAEVIAHEFTAEVLPAPLMGETKPADDAEIQANRERIQKALETGVRSDGTPVTDSMRLYYQSVLQNLDLMNTELGRVRIVKPTRTMTEKLSIDLGNRQIELRHFGRGNTRGDLMLYLPGEGILATGDVVVRPTPYGFGSYPRSWAEVLRQVKALQPRVIVPGHGDIMFGDYQYIDLLIETLDSLADQAESLVAQGKTLEETQAAIDFSAIEERFTGGDPLLALFFNGWFKQPISKAAFNEASGIASENPQQPLSP